MSQLHLEQVRVLTDGLLFPEGPVAMADGSVIVVEVRAGKLSRVSQKGDVYQLAELAGGPNGAAIGPDGAIYVCNNGGVLTDDSGLASIQRVDPETGNTEVLYTKCGGDKLLGPNDLVFDSTGGFWFTDYHAGAIYYARTDGDFIRRLDARAIGPNGIGLSPNEEVLYWSQTPTRQVHRRRLAGPGELVPSPGCDVRAAMHGETVDRWSVLVGLPGASEFDSLAVEAAGAVCVGTLVDGGITVIDPESGTYDVHHLPKHLVDPLVTNICFGGEDMQTAYITCSKTGRLISCRWPRPGLRLAFQQFP
jgi:gluconolactonase